MAKKKRTPAQIRATKRMIAARKKQLRKKKRRPNPARKRTRKKAKKRTTSKRRPRAQFQIACLSKGRLVFRDGAEWTTKRANAARWTTKKTAQASARKLRRKCAVVSTHASPTDIKAALTGKR